MVAEILNLLCINQIPFRINHKVFLGFVWNISQTVDSNTTKSGTLPQWLRKILTFHNAETFLLDKGGFRNLFCSLVE